VWIRHFIRRIELKVRRKKGRKGKNTAWEYRKGGKVDSRLVRGPNCKNIAAKRNQIHCRRGNEKTGAEGGVTGRRKQNTGGILGGPRLGQVTGIPENYKKREEKQERGNFECSDEEKVKRVLRGKR